MNYQADVIIETYFGNTYVKRSRQFRTMFWALVWVRWAALMVHVYRETHPDNGIRWGIKKLRAA